MNRRDSILAAAAKHDPELAQLYLDRNEGKSDERIEAELKLTDAIGAYLARGLALGYSLGLPGNTSAGSSVLRVLYAAHENPEWLHGLVTFIDCRVRPDILADLYRELAVPLHETEVPDES